MAEKSRFLKKCSNEFQDVSEELYDFEGWLIDKKYCCQYEGQYYLKNTQEDYSCSYLTELILDRRNEPQKDSIFFDNLVLNVKDHLEKIQDESRRIESIKEMKETYERQKPHLSELATALGKYPQAAVIQEGGVAKRIYEYIEGRVNEEIAGHDKLQNTKWFHAQRDRCSKCCCCCSGSLYEPKPDFVAKSEGRFHHFSQNIPLYLSETRETAGYEILKNMRGSYWVREYQLLSQKKWLDLRFYADSHYVLSNLSADEEIIASIIYEFSRDPISSSDSLFHPEYVLSRFIADCARACGYDGIIFPTLYIPELKLGCWLNLVLFNWRYCDFEIVSDYKKEKLLWPPKKILLAGFNISSS